MHPEEFSKNRHKDRQALGVLVIHMISGSPDRSNRSDSLVLKMIPIPSIGQSMSTERSPELIDILELYFSEKGSIGNILKHLFLKLGLPGSLSRLVLNTECKV